jgi:sigma-B regulation protein RsbU (phosphoserine phosphatase)
MLPLLRSGIAAFCGSDEQYDDMTMLAIHIIGEIPPSRSITLKAAITELETLNTFIATDLDSGGCPQQIRGQIELAAEEIFVNIARYAYTDTGEVTVDCHKEQAQGKITMTLVFSDRGRPFNPLEHDDPDIRLPLEEREPGGLGLLIVKKTMDRIHYSRENEVNRLEIRKSWQFKEEK